MVETASQDIVLLEPIIEKYSVARHLGSDEQRSLYEGINEIVERDYKNAPAFQTRWDFNEQTGEINGSNIFRAILANKILAAKGERTLTYEEGMKLDKDKKLSNKVYRDFGLAVHSLREPNKEIAELLVKEAEKRSLELPVLVHPSALEISSRNVNNKYGINVLFSDNDSLIVSGEEAREALKKFHAYNSGVCRPCRYWDGDWVAGWVDLAGSSACGRVDWVRGEATRENFQQDDLMKKESELYTSKQIIQAASEIDLNLLRENKLEDILLRKLRNK